MFASLKYVPIYRMKKKTRVKQTKIHKCTVPLTCAQVEVHRGTGDAEHKKKAAGRGTRAEEVRRSRLFIGTLVLRSLEDESLDFVVQDKDQGSPGATKYIRESALEEGSTTFCLVNLAPAMGRALVHKVRLGATALHHHTPPHCVKRV
ncbi:unnamed protein product [Ixodes pacificus]